MIDVLAPDMIMATFRRTDANSMAKAAPEPMNIDIIGLENPSYCEEINGEFNDWKTVERKIKTIEEGTQIAFDETNCLVPLENYDYITKDLNISLTVSEALSPDDYLVYYIYLPAYNVGIHSLIKISELPDNLIIYNGNNNYSLSQKHISEMIRNMENECVECIAFAKNENVTDIATDDNGNITSFTVAEYIPTTIIVDYGLPKEISINEDACKIKGNLNNNNSLSLSMFNNPCLETLELGTEIAPTSINGMCNCNSTITEVPKIDCKNVSNSEHAFINCSNLAHIEGLAGLKTTIDLSTINENANFEEVFNSLASLEEGVNSTVYLSENVYNSLTDSVKNILISKGWTIKTDSLENYQNVDASGLREIGWSFEDIENYNAYSEGKEKIMVPNENKTIFPISKNKLKSAKDSVKFCPWFNIGDYKDINLLFQNFTNLIAIPKLDTKYITEMYGTFNGCSSLTEIPLLDTHNVTNMSGILSICSSLTTVPQLDTSNVTDMSGMFMACSSLETIPQLDTSKVTDMRCMFDGCKNLKTIPQLDTSKVTDMFDMFNECEKLTTIPQLDTSKVTDMRQMFERCSSLTEISLLNAGNVASMNSMFKECSSLTKISLVDASNVIDMSGMFTGCKNLKTISQFDTHNVNYMREMFYGCSSLTKIPLIDTGNVASMNSMFKGCKNLKTIPQFDTNNVTNMSEMFEWCSALTEIPKLDTSKVTDMRCMFDGCSSLTTVPQLDTSNVTSMNGMFEECSAITEIPQLDTSNVTDMTSMFYNCRNLTKFTFIGGLGDVCEFDFMFGEISTYGIFYHDNHNYDAVIAELPEGWHDELITE